MEKKSFTVCVTGAAGQIAYAFLPQLCKGLIFPGIDIHVRLLDITPVLKVMEGVAMELMDCSFPPLKSVSLSPCRSHTVTKQKRCSRMQTLSFLSEANLVNLGCKERICFSSTKSSLLNRQKPLSLHIQMSNAWWSPTLPTQILSFSATTPPQ
jgi:hypothetical protein